MSARHPKSLLTKRHLSISKYRNHFVLLQDLVTNFSKKIAVFIKITGMNTDRDKKRLEEVGAHFRKVREKLNISQDEVVARCDLTKGNLSMIENGKKDFMFTTFLELAKGLRVHPKKLLDGDFDF